MKILVISSNYPSKEHPQKGTFVYNLIQNFHDGNNEVTVISPQKKEFFSSKKGVEYGVERALVYRPTYFSLSNKNIFGFKTYHIGMSNQIAEIKKTVADNDIAFDIVYSHFISNALMAVEALMHYKKPFFVAVGEYKNIEIVRNYYKPERYHYLINQLSGFIAVSPQVKNKLLSIGIAEEKIQVIPNAVDLSRFKKLDKASMRIKYNLPSDKKIVLFIGRFLENKGPLRVLKAVQSLPVDVNVVFIGTGPQDVSDEKVLLQTTLTHAQIPEIMSACDIFVLPTLHEGSSNVIIEAMACGLPIVSSKIPEIQIQCNDTFSVLVDPMNIDHIREAIREVLFDEEKLRDMSNAALQHAKNFDIKERASKILNFIKRNN